MPGLVHGGGDVGGTHGIADDAHERRRVAQLVDGSRTGTLPDGAHDGIGRHEALALGRLHVHALGSHALGRRAEQLVDAGCLELGEQDGPVADVGIDCQPVAHLDDVGPLALLGHQQSAFASGQAAADDGNLVANLGSTQVQIVNRHHARALIGGNGHRDRLGPDGHHDRIRRELVCECGIDRRVQLDVHTRALA